MNFSLPINRKLIALGLPLALLGGLIILMQQPALVQDNRLGRAIAVDLLLAIPLLYFFLIRKTNIPKTTVIPLMVLGLVIGSYFLPRDQQQYLNLFKTWALPVIELSVLSYVILKVRAALRKYRTFKGQSSDFFTTLKSTCREILPSRLVGPFATEVAVIYYGLLNWKRKKLSANEFSYHRSSGSLALLGAFILVIIIETLALHFLLIRWSPAVAWVLSALSVYTALQVFGIARSIPQRPVAINTNSVSLRYGILNEVEIHFDEIDSVSHSTQSQPKSRLSRSLSPLGEMEGHNLIIILKDCDQLEGLYGFKKQFNTLAVALDEPERFVTQLNEAMCDVKSGES